MPLFSTLLYHTYKWTVSGKNWDAGITVGSQRDQDPVQVLRTDLAAAESVSLFFFFFLLQRSYALKCHMGVREGVLIVCFHTCPISTQSVWQASVAITTPPQVAFLSHQPASSPLSVGAFLSHGARGQQTATMSATVEGDGANTQVMDLLLILKDG